MSQEQVIAQEEIPSVTLRLLTGEQEDAKRDAGIFTKEDLINIKLYVKKAISLPVKQQEVEVYIGYTHSGIPGLEPVDITELFVEIHANGASWTSLEDQVLLQSMNLDTSAKQIVLTGEEIISIIDEMPIMERLLALGDISDEQLGQITYTDDDGKVSEALGEILESMKIDIAVQQKKTEEVATSVTDFKDELIRLEGRVYNKKDLMDKNNLSVTIQELEYEIKEKKDRIKQLEKDYDKYVGLSFTGAPGGFIGLAITGGIFGDKAEKVRKEKNELIEEVRKMEKDVTGKKNLQTLIEDLSADFANMQQSMLDAETAMRHLSFMWNSMLQQIEESQRQFKKINDAQQLTSFVLDFKKVIAPWNDVGESAKELLAVLDEAMEEYKKAIAA